MKIAPDNKDNRAPVSLMDAARSAAGRRVKHRIDEWDVTVYLRSMSVANRVTIHDIRAGDNSDNDEYLLAMNKLALTSCVCDKNGDFLLSDEDAEFLIHEAPAPAVEALVAKCYEVSGLAEDSQGDAGKDS